MFHIERMLSSISLTNRQIFPIAKPNPNFTTTTNLRFSSFVPRTPKITQNFRLFAENGNNNNNPDVGTVNGDSKKDGRIDLDFNFNFKLGDLLNPDPDNILAVGLTGLLAWASVQVLLQLFFISTAILGAALKYSFIAALLIFILITLL